MIEYGIGGIFMSEKKRYYYLDYLRTFAICAVVVLHCVCDYYNNPQNADAPLFSVLAYANELARCGVPLFFMISGYLMLSSDIPDIKAFYKKRFIKIGIPFLLYSVFYYFVNFSELSVLGFIKELLNQSTSYHLWFIYTILMLYLITPFIKMITDRCTDRMLILFLVLTVFQTTLKPFINTIGGGVYYLYLTEDFMCGYLGYMILGYILGKCDISLRISILVYIVGILFFAITPYFSIESVRDGGEYLLTGGYNINHYCEAAAIFLLAKQVIKKENKFISMLSAVSFSAYFIHAFIIDKVKAVPFELRPFEEILLAVFVAVVLSFLWGFIVYLLKKAAKSVRLGYNR